MAAYGSGAVARSIREQATVMNVDVGGGTAKIALCADGQVVGLTALDVGARLIVCDAQGRVLRMEAAGRRFARDLGIDIAPGDVLETKTARALAACMADRLFEAVRGGAPSAGGITLLRLEPLSLLRPIEQITFSGGVAEFIYGREASTFNDLGALLAAEIRARAEALGVPVEMPAEGIRATVVGASQYTMQLSGSTIFVSPLETLPLRNLPVIAPAFRFDDEAIDPAAVAQAVQTMLRRLDLDAGESPVALFVPWRGSATFQRLDAFCRGVVAGLRPLLARGHPLVLAGDGDVGGLVGIHLREEMQLENPIVSIDGLELKEFDYIDIGAMLESSGAVPVVIKSLLFPAGGLNLSAPRAR
jgi:ethanolamine utilization protein EutA